MELETSYVDNNYEVKCYQRHILVAVEETDLEPLFRITKSMQILRAFLYFLRLKKGSVLTISSFTFSLLLFSKIEVASQYYME